MSEERTQEIGRLRTAALWYAWGQIDPEPEHSAETNPLRQRGFDIEHGEEFSRLYEQMARDYADEKRSSRSSVLDAWSEFVRSKDRLGIDAELTVRDIDYHVRLVRELAAEKERLT